MKKVSFAAPVILLVIAIIFGAAFAVFQFNVVDIATLNLPDLGLPVGYPILAAAVAGLFLLISIISFIAKGAKQKKLAAASCAGVFGNVLNTLHLTDKYNTAKNSVVGFYNDGAKTVTGYYKQGLKFANGYYKQGVKTYKKGMKVANGFYDDATSKIAKFMKNNRLATVGIAAAVPATLIASTVIGAKIGKAIGFRKGKKLFAPVVNSKKKKKNDKRK